MGDRKRRLSSLRVPGAPRARRAFGMTLRAFADRLLLFGLSEWSLVVLLGMAWISPEFVEGLRPGFIAGLPILFLAEFLFGHAGAGLAVVLKFEGILRWFFVLFLLLMYGIWFVLLFRLGFGIQAAFFLWITLARIYRAERSFQQTGPGKDDRDRLTARVAIPALLRVGFLAVCLILSLVLPLPQLGLARYSGAQPGTSGIFVDHPETVVFLFMLYFTSIPWLERNVFPKVTRQFDR